MTDFNDDARAFLRRLFQDNPPAPPDVVRGQGPTRESLLRMNAMTGQVVTGTTPGELIEGPDGEPIGVGPSTTVRSYFGGVTVTRAELEATGLTEADVPNVKVIDLPPRNTNRKDSNHE